MGWLDQKTFSSFELCSPFMTSTPIFIQIGPKLAKLVFWGRSGGYGVGWLGGVRGGQIINNSGFKLCCPFFSSTPISIQIGPKLAKLVFWGWSGGYGIGWFGGYGGGIKK